MLLAQALHRYLSTAGLKDLGSEIVLTHLEQPLNQFCFSKPLSEEREGGGVWDIVHGAESEKTPQRNACH